MGRSTAPVAEAAIKTRLAARAGFEAALVQIGLPAAVPTADDRVYFAAVDDLTRTREAAKGVRRERYTLNVLIEVERPGKPRDTVRDRMWEIIDELEAELYEDDELDDLVLSAEISGIPTAFTVPAPDGWIGKANVLIRVESLVDLRG